MRGIHEMTRRSLPSTSKLHELLKYDPVTGVLTWKVDRGLAKVGNPAGCTNDLGYILVGIDGRLYRAHRIIWAMVHGECPPELEIDHKDRDPSNNRLDNLRLATRTDNNRNMKMKHHNATGFKGVSIHPCTGKYRARITVDRKEVALGCFDTPEEAYAAYCKAANDLHGDFARVA